MIAHQPDELGADRPAGPGRSGHDHLDAIPTRRGCAGRAWFPAIRCGYGSPRALLPRRRKTYQIIRTREACSVQDGLLPSTNRPNTCHPMIAVMAIRPRCGHRISQFEVMPAHGHDSARQNALHQTCCCGVVRNSSHIPVINSVKGAGSTVHFHPGASIGLGLGGASQRFRMKGTESFAERAPPACPRASRSQLIFDITSTSGVNRCSVRL